MNQRSIILACLATLVSAATYAENFPASILGRETWTFSATEAAQLNQAKPTEVEPAVLAAVAEASGFHHSMGRLMAFKATDLNNDGIVEVLARVDVSGRGLSRDIIVLSRKDGVYQKATVPAYGVDIQTWSAGSGEQFIVAHQTTYELSRVDPLVTYPALYSWTGATCEDASRNGRAYYGQFYAPSFKSSVDQLAQRHIQEASPDEVRRRAVTAIGLARAALTLNALFDEPVVPQTEVAALKAAIEAFKPEIKSAGDRAVNELLLDTEAKLEGAR